jgi:cell fate regulator YaaT (PSP1 superfamily)
MACGSCGTTENGVPKGCKSNGNCGSGTCGSGSEKLAVFDWLSNMTLPSGEERFNIYEVRFKNGRKHFFKNTENLTISMGDVVAVESSPGHDVGAVSLAGELVKVQMKKHNISADHEDVKKIYRKASQKDIDIWQASRDKEEETQRRGREILGRLGLQMKLSDVEYQGDGNKATFYYTAETRVDFRQLIRDLASAFSIRVEMKQVGARQEAARLGGIGSCGRELCCSTWLTDFRKVSTSAARYQQLSLNPLKLAGQCGKLKCCLNFELDSYLDALKSFPRQEVVLKTEKGEAVFIKMDIFKKHLWYTYKEERFKWFRLTLEQVQEIIELNKKNEKSISLEEYEADVEIIKTVSFEDAVGQDSLTRFDVPKTSKRRKNTRNKKAVVAAGNSSVENTSNPQQKRKPQQKRNQNSTSSDANSAQQIIRKKPNKRKPRPVLGDSNTGNDVVQKKPQQKKPRPVARTKTEENVKVSENPNQPKVEGAKANKPRRKNRNRKNNKPKNGDSSQEK